MSINHKKAITDYRVELLEKVVNSKKKNGRHRTRTYDPQRVEDDPRPYRAYTTRFEGLLCGIEPILTYSAYTAICNVERFLAHSESIKITIVAQYSDTGGVFIA